ncbi:MAG: hypothetical protein FWF84_00945 [Kiritimatiellaeota bacterium]|nr:hypothetical protein [Kiritimatiellota bacterium]
MNEDSNKQTVGFSMIRFARKYYRKFFTIFLWIIAIATTIGGLVIGVTGGWQIGVFRLDSAVLGIPLAFLGATIGAALGMLVGLLNVILIGGFMATFLEMGENLQYLADKEKAKA